MKLRDHPQLSSRACNKCSGGRGGFLCKTAYYEQWFFLIIRNPFTILYFSTLKIKMVNVIIWTLSTLVLSTPAINDWDSVDTEEGFEGTHTLSQALCFLGATFHFLDGVFSIKSEQNLYYIFHFYLKLWIC